MRKLSGFVFLIMFALLQTGLSGQSTIQVICNLSGGGNSLFLYEFNGFGFSPKHSVTAEKPGQFIMDVPRQTPRMFYIGQNSDQVIPVILGQEDKVEITGNAENMATAVISNSKENDGYNNLKNNLTRQDNDCLYCLIDNFGKHSRPSLYIEKDLPPLGNLIIEVF